jgi:hypothetical protein
LGSAPVSATPQEDRRPAGKGRAGSRSSPDDPPMKRRVWPAAG